MRWVLLALNWLTMFMIGTDLFVMSPLLPTLAGQFGVSAAAAGLSVTVFTLVYAAAAPCFGRLADRFGRPAILVCGLAGFAAANLATAAVPSFAALLVARLAAGMAAAAVSPSVYALVGEIAPYHRRGTWLALVVSGLLLSLALGAPLGAWVSATFGWEPVFVALGGASFCLIWPNLWLWLHNRPAAAPGPRRMEPLSAGIVVQRLLPMVLWSTALYGMYTYLGAGLTAAGFSTAAIASAIFFYGCGAIAGVLGGGHLADRFGTKFMAAASLLALAICFLMLRLSLLVPDLLGLMLALTSAMAQLFFPAQQSGLVHDFESRRATMLAWNNSALFCGITLGSLTGGYALAFAGFPVNLVICAAIALTGSIVTQIVVPRPRRRRAIP